MHSGSIQMDDKTAKKRIHFNREVIRQLRDAEMARVVRGFAPCEAGGDSAADSPNRQDRP